MRKVRWWLGVWLAVAVAGPVAAAPQFSQGNTVAQVEATHSSDVVIHTLANNSDIIIFDFPSLAQQGRTFNRMVAMIERLGAPHDRVLTNQELADFIRSLGRLPTTFAFGNDFRVSECVRFFNLAADGGIELNQDENTLKDFLVANDLMKEKYNFYQGTWPDKVILSLPQVQAGGSSNGVAISPEIRAAIMKHELAHGEYYSNNAYAEYCIKFWMSVMNDDQRKAFRKYLGGKNYDTSDEELMINETQAYLFHTPEGSAFDPKKVGLPLDEIKTLRAKFWAGNPPSRLFHGG